MPTSRSLSLFILSLAISVSAAGAVTTAHFQAKRVDNVCSVDDSEPITAGAPDLRFHMAIMNEQLELATAARTDKCGFTSTCGSWDFADVTLTKVVWDSSGAWFYFYLVDDDTDEDDHLGMWSKHITLTTSAQEWNNSPAISLGTMCGEALEGTGWADNYKLTYSVWFTDSDGPLPLTAPVALQNGFPTSTDYDQRLDFAWTPTDDPNTGISRYRLNMLDVNTGHDVFQDLPPSSKNAAFSVCASGCGYDYQPILGHQYLFMVSATNGQYPGITNQATVESPWTSVLVADPLAVENPPAPLSLSAPVPNPTGGGTTFLYTLPAAGPARLEVMDLQGRRVALVSDANEIAGPHHVTWSGRGAAGDRVEPGAYWVRLLFANAQRLQRLVVVR